MSEENSLTNGILRGLSLNSRNKNKFLAIEIILLWNAKCIMLIAPRNLIRHPGQKRNLDFAVFLLLLGKNLKSHPLAKYLWYKRMLLRIFGLNCHGFDIDMIFVLLKICTYFLKKYGTKFSPKQWFGICCCFLSNLD